MVPDMILYDLDPADSNLLILPGADIWDAGAGTAFAAARALPGRLGVPWRPFAVPRLASSEPFFLDNRRHTSAAAGYLMATGYAAGDHYVNQRAVDGISSRPARSRLCSSLLDAATLRRLGLASDRKVEAYDGVFHRADATAYPALMGAQDAA
jgi:hypothetical protein